MTKQVYDNTSTITIITETRFFQSMLMDSDMYYPKYGNAKNLFKNSLFRKVVSTRNLLTIPSFFAKIYIYTILQKCKKNVFWAIYLLLDKI